MTIKCYGSGCFKQVNEMLEEAEAGNLDPKTVLNDLNLLAKRGHLVIEKDIRDPFSRTRIVELQPKQVASNPLSGKGKSYADHVENGWGSNFDTSNLSISDILSN